MTAPDIIRFPSRAEREAMRAAAGPNPGVRRYPAAARTAQGELPLSAGAGTSPGYTNAPASAGNPILSPAIGAIADRRRHDMIEHGHTPESDLRHARGALLYRGRHYIENARSWLKKGGTQPPEKRRACYRAALVAACAFFIAEIERLDAEPAAHPKEAA